MCGSVGLRGWMFFRGFCCLRPGGWLRGWNDCGGNGDLWDLVGGGASGSHIIWVYPSLMARLWFWSRDFSFKLRWKAWTYESTKKVGRYSMGLLRSTGYLLPHQIPLKDKLGSFPINVNLQPFGPTTVRRVVCIQTVFVRSDDLRGYAGMVDKRVQLEGYI